MASYDEIFSASMDDPEAFWMDAAGAIDWQVVPTGRWTPRTHRSTGGFRTGS